VPADLLHRRRRDLRHGRDAVSRRPDLGRRHRPDRRAPRRATSTRWGKFRPHVLFGSIPLALSLVALFSIPSGLGDDAKVIPPG
jgi:MFS/sugar transport protein